MIAIDDTTLINLEDITPATMTVAMFDREPHELTANTDLVFRSGYDDLDYLNFAMLTLPSGHDVTLVRHQGSPQPGTELCVRPNLGNVASAIRETCVFLNVNESSLQWIHPNIEQQITAANSVHKLNIGMSFTR
ncbi:hypothetical protein [Chamaesiphon sp.]|uniref:hypothetical protein n=1 Tax=Chamaesiphon sp. TaxID=2814140 RepID=UPI00359300E2